MNLKKKKETEKWKEKKRLLRKICDLDGMVLVDMFFVAVQSWWKTEQALTHLSELSES